MPTATKTTAASAPQPMRTRVHERMIPNRSNSPLAGLRRASTASTRAPDGPAFRRRSSSASPGAEPSATTSTDRSSSPFMTQPTSPSSSACRRTHHRKPTPCTRPVTRAVKRSSLTDPVAATAAATRASRLRGRASAQPPRADRHEPSPAAPPSGRGVPVRSGRPSAASSGASSRLGASSSRPAAATIRSRVSDSQSSTSMAAAPRSADAGVRASSPALLDRRRIQAHGLVQQVADRSEAVGSTALEE